MSDIDALVSTRGKTHGKFEDHARITQALKAIITAEYDTRYKRNQPGLSVTQKEALEMIAHKIGRILAGDANFADHWDDIAGYAKIWDGQK